MAHPRVPLISPLTPEARAAATAITLAPVVNPNEFGADLSGWGDPRSHTSYVFRLSLEANQAVNVRLFDYATSYNSELIIVVYDAAGTAIEAADLGPDGPVLGFTASITGAYFVEGRFATYPFGSPALGVGVDTKVPGLRGNDVLQTNQVDAGPGYDSVTGTTGADTLFGGEGNDALEGGDGRDYLRGDAGDDRVNGGDGADDINGNMGNDTATGGVGDDWVVGGKDNDLLSGEAGHDLVYGNLGSDTCDGGAGNDTILGGQSGDLLNGGAGDDWLSGDRGDDTVTGGLGSDVFHSFAETGLDVVLDFQPGSDRVLLDPGTEYSLAQVNSDVVITMAGGGRVIVVDNYLQLLPTGWLIVG